MNIEKTVAVFVMKEDTVLLTRRLNTWFGNNQFAPPGGLVDKGENPEESAVREVFEETGIRLNAADLQLFSKVLTDGQGRHFENHYYSIKKFTGTLENKEPDRHADVGWYPRENPPEDTMPHVLELLKQL